MKDFASAAMMKLVRDGLARQGFAPPPPTPARDGRVALGDKQALLARLWEHLGPGPVARIGEAIHDVQDDPTLRALILAVDPWDLLALCERVLGQAVRARPLGGRHWLRQQGRWRDGPWPVASDRWLERLQACLRADPGRPWRVDELASACSHSVRSLQRHLAQRQLCFSRMLTDIRVQCAAELLTTSALSVAEVGYHCGFADQPHFSRHFRQSTAVTPARYREQFSRTR